MASQYIFYWFYQELMVLYFKLLECDMIGDFNGTVSNYKFSNYCTKFGAFIKKWTIFFSLATVLNRWKVSTWAHNRNK